MIWNIYPSVKHGGKNFFYVSISSDCKLTVVWDRICKKWSLQMNDKHLAYYASAEEAMVSA